MLYIIFFISDLLFEFINNFIESLVTLYRVVSEFNRVVNEFIRVVKQFNAIVNAIVVIL